MERKMETLKETKTQNFDPLYEELGRLLGEPLRDRQCLTWLREQLVAACTEAAASTAQFEAAFPTGPQGEEDYIRAFDAAPLCAPYVSIHLFGEENYKRGELMSRLLEAYEKTGFDPGFELSDHIAVLLRFLPRLSGEERREMLSYCLKDPLVRMTATLKKAGNPYGHLMQAALDLVETELKKEEAHA